MRFTLFILVAALAACAPTMQAANDRGGMIRLGGGAHKEADALALADAHCRERGQVAHITSQNIVQISFECASP